MLLQCSTTTVTDGPFTVPRLVVGRIQHFFNISLFSFTASRHAPSRLLLFALWNLILRPLVQRSATYWRLHYVTALPTHIRYYIESYIPYCLIIECNIIILERCYPQSIMLFLTCVSSWCLLRDHVTLSPRWKCGGNRWDPEKSTQLCGVSHRTESAQLLVDWGGDPANSDRQDPDCTPRPQAPSKFPWKSGAFLFDITNLFNLL